MAPETPPTRLDVAYLAIGGLWEHDLGTHWTRVRADNVVYRSRSDRIRHATPRRRRDRPDRSDDDGRTTSLRMPPAYL
jgi:hypothetical protein